MRCVSIFELESESLYQIRDGKPVKEVTKWSDIFVFSLSSGFSLQSFGCIGVSQ